MTELQGGKSQAFKPLVGLSPTADPLPSGVSGESTAM